MNNINLSPLYLSLHLAALSSTILIVIGIPIAWWLSQTKNIILKTYIETMIALPLVLPPTILGFYLLLLFNPNSLIGKSWYFFTKTTLTFSFNGLIIGSCIYSIPFVIQPIKITFKKLGKRPIEQAVLLGISKVKLFLKIILPLSKNGILTAFILSFTHTLGEFGVVLMIGGNIPGKTQVISIAIYESVEQLNYTLTHILSIITITISFIILLILFIINNKIK